MNCAAKHAKPNSIRIGVCKVPIPSSLGIQSVFARNSSHLMKTQIE